MKITWSSDLQRALITRIHEIAAIPDGKWQQSEGSIKSCWAKTLKIGDCRG